MRFGSCPKLETCSKIKIARLNRARICCRNPESLESICARCDENQESKKEEKQALVA
jgi:hypothetical protein